MRIGSARIALGKKTSTTWVAKIVKGLLKLSIFNENARIMDLKKPNDFWNIIKMLQINMQNAIHVVTEINHYITKNDIYVALLQEPYNHGRGFGLSLGYGVISGHDDGDIAVVAIVYKKYIRSGPKLTKGFELLITFLL